MPKRNVILISSDQFRWDVLSGYGGRVIQTTNFDQLAGEGVVFTNACSSNPTCIPARATITTGNHSHKCTGIKGNAGRIRDDQVKIAAHFAAHGYETYAIGKLHYVPYQVPRLVHGFAHWELCEEGRLLWQAEVTGEDLGSEEYHDYLAQVGFANMSRAHGIGNNDVRAAVSPLPVEHYVDTWVLNRTVHYLETHLRESRNRPFFAWMSFPKPHSPYDPPEPYHKIVGAADVPEPIGSLEMLAGRNPELQGRHFRYYWNLLSKQMVQLSRARYHSLVCLQDHLIGELLTFLEENDLREDTVILFTADHGDLLGDFGLFFKSCFLNGSVRIPFVLSYPSALPRGQERAHLVGLEDVLPTLCDLAGIAVPPGIDGRSVLPVVQDPGGRLREIYISQHGDDPNQLYMAFDGRMKYCYAQQGRTEELYDQENDPRELVNLAREGSHRSRVKDLRDAVIAWCRENGDDHMLDGQGWLKEAPVAVEHEGKPQPGMLGWRKY